MLLNLFSSRPDHPLAEAKELRRVIGELPLDHPYKAVDEVHGWFESLLVATDFRADLLFGVVRQLDEAAQPFLRRLARDCLQVQGVLQARRDEQRMATLLYAYWGELANLYTRCLDAARQAPKERAAEALKPSLPLIAARLIAARARSSSSGSSCVTGRSARKSGGPWGLPTWPPMPTAMRKSRFRSIPGRPR